MSFKLYRIEYPIHYTNYPFIHTGLEMNAVCRVSDLDCRHLLQLIWTLLSVLCLQHEHIRRTVCRAGFTPLCQPVYGQRLCSSLTRSSAANRPIPRHDNLSGPGHPVYRSFAFTLRHTTLCRTALDKWSVRRGDHHLTTHNIFKRQTSMPPSRVRTRNLSKPAAADSRLRPRGQWDRKYRSSLF